MSNQQSDSDESKAWLEIKSRLVFGQRVHGTVTRQELFGIFVDIGERIVAYVDSSELEDGGPGEKIYPNVGDEVEGVIIQLNDITREIRLTLRSLAIRKIHPERH